VLRPKIDQRDQNNASEQGEKGKQRDGESCSENLTSSSIENPFSCDPPKSFEKNPSGNLNEW